MAFINVGANLVFALQVGDYKNRPYRKMKADMTKDCEVLTVNSVSFVHGRGPVFYASLTSGSSTSEPLKHFLVSTLLDNLAAVENPFWKHSQSFERAVFPIKVVRGLLGRPHLRLGEYPGPAISFSECGGKIWAALCGDDSDIGIDAAESDEFQGDYPFHRVFHTEELQYALKLTGGVSESAASLLWSVKEAAVKALGSAFHLVDPRQITVCPSEGDMYGGEIAGPVLDDLGYTFSVRLSGKALDRFPLAAASLSVHSLSQRKSWLSIALLNWRLKGYE